VGCGIDNDMFWPIDAHRILKIPLTPNREDFVAWNYTKTCLYTVRLGYHCQWEHKFGRHNQISDFAETTNNQVWDKLRNMEIPSKIKIF
jgi:hypothetical protein